MCARDELAYVLAVSRSRRLEGVVRSTGTVHHVDEDRAIFTTRHQPVVVVTPSDAPYCRSMPLVIKIIGY